MPAFDYERTRADLSEPAEQGVWVPLSKGVRKGRLPSGGTYLRGGFRDAWAYGVEYQGRVLTRMLVIRMDPRGEELSGMEPGTISARDLRDVNLSQVDNYVRNFLPVVYPELLSAGSIRRLKEKPPQYPYQRRSDDWHAEVAELYLRALVKDSRRPIVWMHRYYQSKGNDCTADQVREWVRVARRNDYLTPGRQGSPGAEPGGQLIQWREIKNTGASSPS